MYDAHFILSLDTSNPTPNTADTLHTQAFTLVVSTERVLQLRWYFTGKVTLFPTTSVCFFAPPKLSWKTTFCSGCAKGTMNNCCDLVTRSSPGSCATPMNSATKGGR